MTILHLLYAGGTGGIEKLCKDIALYSHDKNIFIFVHEGGVICSEMKEAGAEIIELNLQNLEFLKLAKIVKALLKKYKADCVVVHHPSPLIWFAMLLIKVKDFKLYVYAHNGYLEIVSRKRWKTIIYNLLLKKCSRVIAISEFVKKSIVEESKIKSDKVSVVYNGIEISDYQCQRGASKDGVIRLIYVGRLIREKGVQVLIEALTKLEDKKDFQLTIIGDGSYRKILEEMVQKYELTDMVRFEGIRRDVGRYLSNADVFIHPAIWEEGFGITIIEAMSAGLICVAFKKGAIPEIIEDNISGFIVKDCNSTALAIQLEKIRENFNEKCMLDVRQNAINRAKIFSIENVVRELHSVYLKN